MTSRIAVAMAAILIVTTSALADLPGPRTRPPGPPRPVPRKEVAPSKATVAVKFEHADLAREGKSVRAKIAIPRKLLAKVAPGVAAADGAMEEQQAGLPWWGTVIAGIALSAGAVGAVFVARGNKAARVVGTVAVVIAALAGGYAIADLRIPDDEERAAERHESVILEIIEEGDAVVVTLRQHD